MPPREGGSGADAGTGGRGRVHLVGAGPGDPGLLTLRGRRCLEGADVVVYDYLANPALLRFAPSTAERIFCGKHGGDTPILTQEEINRLLVDRARAGKVVVRLKGGDPFIFGRGGEECQELVSAGIPFEVVPGVTAATAVPACAGIPLTHRDFTSTVTFVAGHAAAEKTESDVPWQHLAHGGTLVLLMSTTQLEANLVALRRHGLRADTPAALVRWGTMPAQQTIVGTVGDLAERVARLALRPPTVVVIGEVVTLRAQLRWFENRPLFGRSIVVTRAREQATDFVEQLEGLGAGVLLVPAISIGPPPSYAALDAALGRLDEYRWVIFTSVNGVEGFLRRLAERGGDVRRLAGARLAAIGPQTARALARAHLRADLVPAEFRAEALLEAMSDEGLSGRRVLLPRAAVSRDVLPAVLRERGAVVDDVPVYAVCAPALAVEDVRRRLRDRTLDLLTFASSATVRHFVDLVGAEIVRDAVRRPDPQTGRRVRVGCIGPVTAETAHALGLVVDVQPASYTIRALTDAIVAYFREDG
jgi:uroporphyrinogen III methyltransferase/synthase